jgi:hypothetical protein
MWDRIGRVWLAIPSKHARRTADEPLRCQHCGRRDLECGHIPPPPVEPIAFASQEHRLVVMARRLEAGYQSMHPDDTPPPEPPPLEPAPRGTRVVNDPASLRVPRVYHDPTPRSPGKDSIWAW